MPTRLSTLVSMIQVCSTCSRHAMLVEIQIGFYRRFRDSIDCSDCLQRRLKTLSCKL